MIIFCGIVLILVAYQAQAQSVSYSFISGTKFRPSQPAVFPSTYDDVSSSPGGRSNHKITIFNGLLYTFHGHPVPRNDVWAFNITDKEWVWKAGNATDRYIAAGTRGTPSQFNTPGTRNKFGGDIHRARREYVLYGGYIGAYRSDLWTFNLTSNMWTWLAGPNANGQNPFYLSMGESNSGTTPGARYGMACAILPSTGEFLLYGGFFISIYRTDMWAFNFTSLEWTWISGSSDQNSNGVLGIEKEWSTAFYPRSRRFAELAVDTKSDTVYMFGGNVGGDYLNDFWAFKRSTLEWALLSGGNRTDPIGNCGIKGVASPNNSPGARFGHSMVYHKNSGLLILIAGEGYSCSSESGYLSDTWAFDPSSSEWIWMAGLSYGVLTSSSVSEDYSSLKPQQFSAVAVHPETGGLYIFGGSSFLSRSVNFGLVDYVWCGSISNRLNISESLSSNFMNAEQSSATISSEIHFQPSKLLLSSEYNASEVQNLIGSTDVASSLRPSGITSQTNASGVSKSTKSITGDYSRSQVAFVDITTQTNAPRSKATEMVSIDRNSHTNSQAQENSSAPFWSALRVNANKIVTGVLSLIFLISFVILMWTRQRQTMIGISKPSGDITEFGEEISTFTDEHADTTYEATMIGLYMPGGLQIDGKKAYRLENEIAKGGGGVVWLATALDPFLCSYGARIIVKVPNANDMSKRAVALFEQEVAIMNSFKETQNIVKLLGYSDNPFSIVLKFYRYGSLSKWISRGHRSLAQSHGFLKDVAHAISTLHSNGIVHCDLKLENILIDEGGSRLIGVVADFEIARIVTDQLLKVEAYQVQHINGASIAYASPEAIKEFRKLLKVRLTPEATMSRDIYAIGVIINSLLVGKRAWK